MPVVEKTSGGQVVIRSLGRQFETGDREEVPDELAAYLTEERGDFEVVQATDVDYTEADEGDGSGGQEDEPPDAEDFSANGWLENDYKERADAVLEGGLDDYLDEIEDVETSETVTDAVEQRRDELEE